ncbi:MAG: tRNA (adenosine(37)-N6)-threonylcarbamoyltransferase complex ATPase subunit type 1 TsaE [SAR86 cluster bacterium]|uniref:tRNA threonylcarbamoyladenosine biosynthesis protein TsaE n=1 Tax=SAR86 cluster bacterium TaxID=2030880 RepID=A0A2A4X389_9GAMM|nr:MAG: tRNA (adenosine(37)-N6)-threonylcarbamoyltransferase complex ATPase subunit type 1 TsaE [SAR86 cluster bacterium]
MRSEHQATLKDEAATLEFGARLAVATFQKVNVGELSSESRGIPHLGGMIHLQGDLGAGKTTLTRGIMRGFGYTGAVKSPTYTLVEPYEFELCNIYHFDLYRLSDPEEVAYLGTDEYFAESNLCLVEWAEKGAKWLPQADLVIDIADEGTGRRLTCQSLTEKGAIIAKRLWP